MPRCSSSERNLATGEFTVVEPSSAASTRIHTRPLAPQRLARSVRSSSRLRVVSPRRRRGRMPLMHDALNALNSVSANTSVSSTSSMPKRTSGLSEPKRSMRVVPGHPRDVADGLTGDGLDHGAHRRGDRGEHVVLADEAHLGVELGELELAVGAQVLVAEAAGDLVVAVDAADHAQLLEQLGALRQRVERAGLRARRHDEVAGTFGRRRDQHRRLDLDEALGVHRGADRAS